MKRQQETLLKKRTARLEKELATKKRELQIETALEKVRAVALSMKEPAAMLEVCRVIALQLEKLGTKEIRNVQTAIFYEGKGTYMNYEYYARHKKTVLTETSYTDHKISKAFATKMLKGKGELFITHIKGKKVQEWIAYQKTTNVFIDKYLKKASSLNYYWCSLGPVALGISTYVPLSRQDIQLFNRFRNVFELCYRRFKDIEQAIAQTREAEIELALERVRARTMAMQKSEELAETAFILLQQFNQLGETPEQITIGIINEPERVVELWLTLHGNQLQHMLTISIDEPNVISKAYAAWKKQKKSLIIDLQGSQLKAYNDYRNSISDFKVNNDRTENRRVINFAFFSRGLISVSAPEPMLDEGIKLLERFAAVFDGTYTRFLDLQKAEAQAREAQIETALEKVRSRSLAMHKSDELREVIAVVFDKLTELNFHMDGRAAIINIFTEGSKVFTEWAADPGQSYPINFTMPDMPFDNHSHMWIAREKGIEFSSGVFNKEEKKPFFAYLIENTNYKYLPKEIRERMLGSEPYSYSVALAKNSGIAVPDLSGKLLSTEEIEILKRFTKVFDQAYTRFLDLKKAEAQAREAQIETALERVRSRSMGMQKSEELKEVIKIVYQQLTHLKINLDHSGFVIDYTPGGDWHFWIADEQDIPSKITHPYFESVWANQFNEAKEKAADFFATNLNFEEKNKFYNELLSYVPGLPEASKDFYLSCPDLAASTVLFDDVSLYIENFSGIPYTDEENKILMRFGKVFQQTYTRFLDLQKAEEQAREAQVQLALERVRARTMAMQRSDELKDAAALLFQQAKALGVPAYSCGYNIWEKDDTVFTSWMSTQDGSIINAVFNIPLTEDANFIRYAESKQNGEQFFVLELRGQRMQEHYEYLKTIPAFKGYFDYAISVGFHLPETQIHHLVNFSCGNLLFITLEPCPEFHAVFERFAAVFEQTYTRFLDLQKSRSTGKRGYH